MLAFAYLFSKAFYTALPLALKIFKRKVIRKNHYHHAKKLQPVKP